MGELHHLMVVIKIVVKILSALNKCITNWLLILAELNKCTSSKALLKFKNQSCEPHYEMILSRNCWPYSVWHTIILHFHRFFMQINYHHRNWYVEGYSRKTKNDFSWTYWTFFFECANFSQMVFLLWCDVVQKSRNLIMQIKKA